MTDLQVIKKTCEWELEEPEDDTGVSLDYNTSCGNMFVIMDGSPKENGFKFCTFCGGELVEKARKEIEG